MPAGPGASGEVQHLYQEGTIEVIDALRVDAATLTLRWNPEVREHTGPASPEMFIDSRSAMNSLFRLFMSDLIRTWRPGEAARLLSFSTRNLQRSLRLENTTFSDTLKKTRVEAVQRLMQDERLSLTEIAFCVGFSDLAHFSRVFCEYVDVPPSAYRTLVTSV